MSGQEIMKPMNPNTNFFLIPLLMVVLIFLSSCSLQLYAPNSENVPLFTEKKEARLEANFSGETDVLSTSIFGFNFQGAYAVSNHVGVMSNLFFAGGEDIWSEERASGGLFEAGAGYFQTLSQHVVFETYGGGGIGWVKRESYYNNSASHEKLNGQRIFVQPALGFTSKSFDAAFSLRCCELFYNNSSNANGDSILLLNNRNNSSMVVEPAITLRAGGQHVKFQTQFGISFNLNDQQEIFYSTVGICIRLSPKNKHPSTTILNQN